MSHNPYFEHDERGADRAMGRNRKFYSRGNRGAYAGGSGRPRPHDNTVIDIDMNGPGRSAERRFLPYNSAPRSQRRDRRFSKNHNKNKSNMRERHDNEGSWFKISIPHGKKLGKDFVLKSILAHCRQPFTPYNYHLEANGNAAFYVTDHQTSLSIRDVNRRITTPDGFKMAIFSNKCAAPSYSITIDAEVCEKIKVCMSNHYDTITHMLDLKKFHNDQYMKMAGLYVPLSRVNIFASVLKIIKDNIPEIESLDLSDNRLFTLDACTTIVNECKELKALSLANNRLKSISELNHLRGLNLLELNVDGNPLCDDFKDKSNYINAVRERFPKLLKLDGHELPAPIVFELENDETVPQILGSFFMAEDVKGLVIQFLEEYYKIYDSDDRGKLLDAYHDHARFSMNQLRPLKQRDGSSVQIYNTENRNLTRVTDSNFRSRLLKEGKLSVVSALMQLPQTHHDPNSFIIDIFHVSPGLMTFSVNGVFKEVGHDMSNQPLRSFQRTFLVVAQGRGFVILNELLFLSSATPEQVKANKFPAPTPSPSPAPSTSSIGDKSPSEKQQMAIEFSKFTNMNLEFSAKCLEENEWDYQKAAMVFNELKNMGRIPPQAFVQM